MDNGGAGPGITVVGSINADLVCRCERLPGVGETVLGEPVVRLSGGKGANQAVAAARLGAVVTMVGAVGDDELGQWLVEDLMAAGVSPSGVRQVAGSSGIAFVILDHAGQNQIVVAPGANAKVSLEAEDLVGGHAVLAQLEIPLEVVIQAARLAGEANDTLFCLNPSPVRLLPPSLIELCDLIVVNDTEYQGIPGLDRARRLVVTHGAQGATMLEFGHPVATAVPPPITVVDTVGAGDAFAGAIVCRLALGDDPESALGFACAAGALATTRIGARTAMPTTEEVLACLRNV
jgi:ribokinase